MANPWRGWYEQGKRDYERALLDLRYGYYEWACFTCRHAAEKVLRALGLVQGVTLWGRSLTEMLKRLEVCLDVPEEVRDQARRLDFYYIPPRYPNGFASGKPADYFTEPQAREALDAADRIVRFCEGYFSGSG